MIKEEARSGNIVEMSKCLYLHEVDRKEASAVNILS